MQRSEDGRDTRRFRSFTHSTCKTVLNLLEAVYLRFRKIAVERVTVVKFRVDNRGTLPNAAPLVTMANSYAPTGTKKNGGGEAEVTTAVAKRLRV